MTRLSALFSRYWRNIHIGLVVVLAALLIYNPPPVTQYLSHLIVGGLYLPFSKLKTTVTEFKGAAEANALLRTSLMEASMKVSRLEETERENQRLRKILGFDPPPAHILVPAIVISVSGDPVPTSAVINRGTEDSVRVGQAIINEQGLVGRISAVTSGFATVQLLTDPANRVAARLTDGRGMGIARFRTGQGLILDNFPVQDTVEAGDRVISSGLGRVYPPGLNIGTVDFVVRPDEEPFCDVRLLPAANFNSIEELFILRPLSL